MNKRKNYRQKKWDSGHSQKFDIRNHFLFDNAKVLDLYCGKGLVYEKVYKNNPKVKKYIGVDNKYIFNTNFCFLMDNLSFLKANDISEFNVFDLDAYGQPWKQIYSVLGKPIKANKVLFFVTDGSIQGLKFTGSNNKVLTISENKPYNMKIKSVTNFYPHMFATMVKKACSIKNIFEIEKLNYFTLNKTKIWDWVIVLKKI